MGTAAQTAARSIPIDYRAMQRDSANDVAISHIDAPDVAAPGESFMIAAWVHAPIAGEISYELLRNNQRLSAGKRSVPSGLSRLIFRDKAVQPGTHQYSLRIAGNESDPVLRIILRRSWSAFKGLAPYFTSQPLPILGWRIF